MAIDPLFIFPTVLRAYLVKPSFVIKGAILLVRHSTQLSHLIIFAGFGAVAEALITVFLADAPVILNRNICHGCPDALETFFLVTHCTQHSGTYLFVSGKIRWEHDIWRWRRCNGSSADLIAYLKLQLILLSFRYGNGKGGFFSIIFCCSLHYSFWLSSVSLSIIPSRKMLYLRSEAFYFFLHVISTSLLSAIHRSCSISVTSSMFVLTSILGKVLFYCSWEKDLYQGVFVILFSAAISMLLFTPQCQLVKEGDLSPKSFRLIFHGEWMAVHPFSAGENAPSDMRLHILG